MKDDLVEKDILCPILSDICDLESSIPAWTIVLILNNLQEKYMHTLCKRVDCMEKPEFRCSRRRIVWNLM